MAFIGVTCSDDTLGPRSPGGLLSRIGFAPAFSQAATQIFQNLEAFGYEVNNVRVHLEHANGRTAKDTTIIIAAGQDSVVIQMNVSLDAPQEDLSADIQLRDDSTTLFSGSQRITARVGGTSASPAVPVEFTGPGATATTLTVAPKDTVVITGDSLVLRPVAKDNNGQNVANVALAWSVTDATRGTVNGNGVFKAATGVGRGSTYVIARLLSGPKDSANIVISLPATKLVLVSGAGQSGVVGQPLAQAFVVEAQAADNLPVPNVPLNFGVTSGGGSVSNATAFTDSKGRAAVTLTLGTVVGTNTIQAAAPGVTPLPLSATSTHGSASKLAFLQQPTNAAAGEILSPPVTVEVLDAFNNRVTTGTGSTSSITLSLSGGTAGAVLGPSPAAATQNAVAGVATFGVSVNTAGTGYQLSASRSGLSAATSSGFGVTGVAFTIVAETGNYLRFDPGTTAARIGVKAANGASPVPGVSVDFTDARGVCQFNAGTTAVTDASGIARIDVTLPTSLASCAIQAQPAGVQNPPFEQLAFLRVFGAPTGTPFWIGQTSPDWSTNSNWFGNIPPSPGGPAFIPAGWLGLDAIPQLPTATTTLDSLTLELGATLLNPATLVLNAMAVDGVIQGGTVVVDGRSRTFRAGYIEGLLKVSTNSLVTVSGSVVADSIELSNPLVLDQDFPVSTLGAFRTVGNGRINQLKGVIQILGDATFGAPTGLTQLTAGSLHLGGNFTLNTNSCSGDISSSPNHVTQIVATSVDTVRFNWDGCEASLGLLNIAGTKPVLLAGPAFESLYTTQIIVQDGATLIVPASFFLSFFSSGTDVLTLAGPASKLVLVDVNSVSGLTCFDGQGNPKPLQQGDNFGFLRCVGQ